MQRQAGGRAVQNVQHAAVGHQNDLLAFVLRSQFIDGFQDALAQRDQRLATTGGRPFGHTLAPLKRVLGQFGFDLGKCAALKHTKMPLAQTSMHRDCLAHGLRNRTGRGVGAG